MQSSRSRRRPRGRRPLAALLLAAAALVAVGVVAIILANGGSGGSARLVESIFQDDDHLIYASTTTVQHTLDELRSLGVDRVRLTILWAAIAPDPLSPRPPQHFAASDPRSYPVVSWAPYDRVLLLAHQRGIGVDFNLTAPGPLWAMGHPAPSAKIANHLRPDPRAFQAFATAVGRRYDGHHVVRVPGAGLRTLPRVSYWTVWNEPNQPGWLYPQWRSVEGQTVMNSPRLYRLYVDAAFAGLAASGHTPAHDTFLIGELAPEGDPTASRSAAAAIGPLPFIRALYCVDESLHPLQGQAAALLHCPAGGDRSAFVRAHPGLFQATGFAHHPYFFFLPPAAPVANPAWVPLSELGRLETTLDGLMATYGVSRRLPIYLTEYGYETNPPNPFRGVSLARQAAYLDQAQYMASRDPRVRALAQFLLFDALPNTAYPRGSIRYWSTFQTGLRFADGAPKPALEAYRLPIFVPGPNVSRGGSVTVWGMLRAAPNSSRQSATIQWRAGSGGYRTLARVSTDDPSGMLSTSVSPSGSGRVRIAWRDPSGRTWYSRAVAVGVR